MQKNTEFVLIAVGYFDSVDEAKNALFEPYIEEFVEETGSFKAQDYENICPVSGISLSDLEIAEIDDDLFEISLRSSPKILNQHKAERLAENLRRQLIFEEINVEPLD